MKDAKFSVGDIVQVLMAEGPTVEESKVVGVIHDRAKVIEAFIAKKGAAYGMDNVTKIIDRLKEDTWVYRVDKEPTKAVFLHHMLRPVPDASDKSWEEIKQSMIRETA